MLVVQLSRSSASHPRSVIVRMPLDVYRKARRCTHGPYTIVAVVRVDPRIID